MFLRASFSTSPLDISRALRSCIRTDFEAPDHRRESDSSTTAHSLPAAVASVGNNKRDGGSSTTRLIGGSTERQS